MAVRGSFWRFVGQDARVADKSGPLDIVAVLQQLGTQEQVRVALELATLVLPLAQLSTGGQPEQGLSGVADVIRGASDPVDVDAARHELWRLPEQRLHDEPEGAEWFAFGASVAWLYAADAVTTAPSDGVVNTFKRVCDLLDAIDDELEESDLLGDLLRMLATDQIESGRLTGLAAKVERSAQLLELD